MSVVYCLDTSAWTHIKRLYPFQTFPSLWEKLNILIQDDRLISPREVYEELRKQDDEVFRWTNERRKLFRNLDDEQIAVAADIVSEFPSLIDPQKETPDADPFVIALALVERKNLAMLRYTQKVWK